MTLLPFFLLVGAVFGVLLAYLPLSMHYDVVVVTLMRWFNYQPYPLAADIARLIYEHPDHWTADEYYLSHPLIGRIWTANSAYGLHVENKSGRWVPNKIERRIIRNAVDWRIREYVKASISQVITPPQAPTLTQTINR